MGRQSPWAGPSGINNPGKPPGIRHTTIYPFSPEQLEASQNLVNPEERILNALYSYLAGPLRQQDLHRTGR